MVKEKIAQIWPEWEVEKQLGKGSYGEVYQAIRRDGINDRAAIKVISIPSDSSELDSLRSEGASINDAKTFFKGIVNDFMNEIRLMNSLKGMQNIVSVEDYKVIERTGEVGWDIYIRMELLTPFNTYIRDKQLTEKEVLQLGVHICTALEICSKRNIIHRDIKPENIFINDFGYFKLGDFGIARNLENSTGGMSQKGTLNYMAPEVANSNEYDARVDIYSLGIVLYRLLNNNRLPFIETEQQQFNPNERKNAMERRIRGEQMPSPCAASNQTASVILKACAFNPDDRFASATEMKTALQQALEHANDLSYAPPETENPEPSSEVDFTQTQRVRRTFDESPSLTTPPVTSGVNNIPKPPVSIPPAPQRPPVTQMPPVPQRPPMQQTPPIQQRPPMQQRTFTTGTPNAAYTPPTKPVYPQQPSRKINSFCLIALILCALPLLFAIIAEAAKTDSLKVVNRFLAFIPPVLAVIGILNAKRTNTKGVIPAIISLAIGILYVVGAIATFVS